MNSHSRGLAPLAIPAGARAPENPSPPAVSFEFEDSPTLDLWESFDYIDSPRTARPSPLDSTRPRAHSAYGSDTTATAFSPASQEMHRTSSASASRSSFSPLHRFSVGRGLSHKSTRSESNSLFSVNSDASSINDLDEQALQEAYPIAPPSDLSRTLSNLSLDSEEGLRRFQAGRLTLNDGQWHRLVPNAAREALGKREVERQGNIFEFITSEMQYVKDLDALKDVYIIPLRNADPPIIPFERLNGFMKEVFANIDDIIAYDRRMLFKLFERQADQHPVVQSIADIILDTAFQFLDSYEEYFSKNPIALARHGVELKRNPRYADFIENCSRDPRLQRNGFTHFLSRPILRLGKGKMTLEKMLKSTSDDHPDLVELPLVIEVIHSFLKRVNEVISVANAKVNFWNICEGLIYKPGEILDLDLYGETRTLVYSSTLVKAASDSAEFRAWGPDLEASLFDNYFLWTEGHPHLQDTGKRVLAARPFPLEYLRLGSFRDPPEIRKEGRGGGGDEGSSSILSSFRHQRTTVFPFTIYHASDKAKRRHTFHAKSEIVRSKWEKAFTEACALRRLSQDANMWFAPHVLPSEIFRVGAQTAGNVTCATPFMSGGKKYIAVGCATGIYLSVYGHTEYRKVLSFRNPTAMMALSSYNKFLVHYEGTLLSYSLDLLARVSQGRAQPQNLDSSLEKLAGHDGSSVMFARVAKLGMKTMLVYMLRTPLSIHTVEVVDPALEPMSPPPASSRRKSLAASKTFRPFGDAMRLPKEAFDAAPLVKSMGLTTDRGIIVVDPTNLSKRITMIPNFSQASGNKPMLSLKTRCDASRPLGLLRCAKEELLVIYTTFGCYITKHGEPTRSSGFIRWETPAIAYAQNGHHILLFSSQFIEIRNINTSRLVQVLEGDNIRLLHCGPREGTGSDAILVARTGKTSEADEIIEMRPTSEITHTPSANVVPVEAMWDSWDM